MALWPLLHCIKFVIFPVYHREGSRFYFIGIWSLEVVLIFFIHLKISKVFQHHYLATTSFQHLSPFFSYHSRLHSLYCWYTIHSFLDRPFIHVSLIHTSTIHIHYITYTDAHLHKSHASQYIDHLFLWRAYRPNNWTSTLNTTVLHTAHGDQG